MRVLFLHATWHTTSEYKVHQLLAENVDPQEIDPYFIWQDSAHNYGATTICASGEAKDIYYWDFGRDMTIMPKPPKVKRALMMLFQLPNSLRFIAQKVRETKADVLYTSQQSYEVILADLIARWFNIPHVIHISYPVGPWLGLYTLSVIRKNKYLIACSDYVRQSALDAGIAPEQIQTLVHGADVREYAIAKDGLALRQMFNWPADTPVVTVAARLDPFKGYELLLDAFVQVHQTMPQARLLVCGEATIGTTHDQVIKQKVIDLGLEEVVHFAGFRRDLAQILAGSDVFCLPTENDALPLVFLAAMAAGLPTVACDSGGVPEMVIDGETGYLSALDDANGLANNILRLLQDPQLAKTMGAAGKLRALTYFDPKRIAHRWTQIMQRWFYKQAMCLLVGNYLSTVI